MAKSLDEAIENLDSNPIPEPIEWYWRSPTTSQRKERGNNGNNGKWTVVFVDVMIQLQAVGGNNVSIGVCFGALLRERSNIFYCKSGEFTLPILQSHFEKAGIELDSTAPAALATSMGQALVRTGAARALVQENGNQQPSAVVVPLHYDAVDETSNLMISPSELCKLNQSTLAMILANCAIFDKPRTVCHPQDGTKQTRSTEELLRQFTLRLRETSDPTTRKRRAEEPTTVSPESQTSHSSPRKRPARKPMKPANPVYLRRSKPKKLKYGKA